MRFRVGRQHPLDFADQPRVPAARLFDKANAVSRRVIQGGFEGFSNLLVVLWMDDAARLIQSVPSPAAIMARAKKRKSPTIIAETGRPGSHFGAASERHDRLGADHRLACAVAQWR